MRDHELDRDPPSADLQAAEYVLGVLDAAQRREARLRVARDSAFARLVDEWNRRLAPLVEELTDEVTPPHVWPRIRSRLGWAPVESADRPGGGKLAFWRGAAATGFAAAAALAVVALQKPRDIDTRAPIAAQPAAPVTSIPAAMTELPVAQIVTDKGAVAYLATVDTRTGGMWLAPVPGLVPAGERLPVLWLIPPGQKPRSLGYVGASRSHWVGMSSAELHKAMEAGWVLAITMEPAAPVAPQAPSTAPMATGSLSL